MIGVAISLKDPKPRELKRCLDSVERAKHHTRVMICVNGPTTHEIYILLRQYGFETRFFPESLGPAGDWNRCVDLLDGCEWITFVHGDDWVDPTHFMFRSPCRCDINFASLIYHEPYWRRVAHAIKQRKPELLLRPRTYTPDLTGLTVEKLLQRNTLPCFALIRHSVWDILGGYDDGCDYDLWVRALKLGATMGVCPVPTYHYTVHGYAQGYMEALRAKVRQDHSVTFVR